MDELKINVVGLKQISKQLRAIDKEAPKGMRIALNGVADVFVARVRPKIPTRSGAAARSIVASSTRTTARIAVGGKRAPYFPWLDFGGQGRIKGRPAARPFIAEGRYVYPTLRDIRPQIAALLDDAVADVVRAAGLDVS